MVSKRHLTIIVAAPNGLWTERQTEDTPQLSCDMIPLVARDVGAKLSELEEKVNGVGVRSSLLLLLLFLFFFLCSSGSEIM